jgi:thiol:disulfide interchange protein DsbD
VVIGLLIMLYGLLAVIGGAQGNVSLLKPLASPAIPADKIGQLNFYQVNSIKQAKLAIAKAAKQGKPVLLDFYADWCIACKEMEATTLVNPAVQKTLKHFVLLQVNITHETPSLKALQKQYGIIAPPSFVFFDSQGRQLKGREIVGAMAAPAFLQHLQDVLALK